MAAGATLLPKNTSHNYLRDRIQQHHERGVVQALQLLPQRSIGGSCVRHGRALRQQNRQKPLHGRPHGGADGVAGLRPVRCQRFSQLA